QQVGLAGVLTDVGAADGYGHYLCTGSLDGLPGFFHVLVLAGSHQQTGTVTHACNLEGVFLYLCHGLLRRAREGLRLMRSPPPMAWTISTRSPSFRRVSAYWLRGTISRFSSMASRLPVNPRRSTRSATLMEESRGWASPFSWICMEQLNEG